MAINLPTSKSINTGKLGRIFDDMSESYKLFWFKSIVDFVFEGKTVLSFDEIVNNMIAEAWYMVSEYKLNLGPSDIIEKCILMIFDGSRLKSSEKKETIVKYLENNNDRDFCRIKNKLTRYVPKRFQSPFMDDVNEKERNSNNIIEIINSHSNLLYYFDNNKKDVIRITDDFADYIKKNYEIVLGWVRYKMIIYLQKRNPSVPGIGYKLDPPTTRQLNIVTKYWKEVSKETRVFDIYTGIDLNKAKISIDHFVPWSYVAHDELWNLIPTTRSINSSKSNYLPVWEEYFPKLCRLQYNAYEVSRVNSRIEKTFNDCLDKHVNDQKIRFMLYDHKQSETEFFNKMEEIIKPVYNAAKELGFSEWKVKQTTL